MRMGDRTLTRADLAEAVFRKIGLSRTESAQLVEMVLEEICSTIANGESVKVSSFGSFLVREKNERGTHARCRIGRETGLKLRCMIDVRQG